MEDTNKRENNKRLAKNTILLSIRTIFMMFLGLLTSRIVFETLGVEDFGLYNVVGGFVSMFTLVNSSLTSTSSRFISVELGKKDGKPKDVFSSTLAIHSVLAILIFFLAETFGLWFVNTQLNIDPERIFAANLVYQASLFSFLLGVVFVPFNSSIIAHERMGAFAYMTIFDASVKLILVFTLRWIPFDKLVYYAFFWLFVDILTKVIYCGYCRRNFGECRFELLFDKSLFKQMFSFAGWNMLGSSAAIMSGHGVNILINIFCGTALNAARGIGARLDTLVMSFVGNFMTALNPQITKSYASGDLGYTYSLINRGTKFSFFLLLFFSLPVLFETEFLLGLWLGSVPEYSVEFARCIILFSLSHTFSSALITVMLATGKIRKFQIFDGIIIFSNFPLSYLSLYIGLEPYWTAIISIVMSFVALFVRLKLLKEMIGFPVVIFVKEVLLRTVFVAAMAFAFPSIFYFVLEAGIVRFIILSIVCVISTLFFVFNWGMDASELKFVKEKAHQLKEKFLCVKKSV